MTRDYEELAKRAEALFIMDEVGSNNPLGRELATAIRELLAERDELRGEVAAIRRVRDAAIRQAESWAMEARTHKSSLHQAYQALTGKTGEPGDWNGARPIIEARAALNQQKEVG